MQLLTSGLLYVPCHPSMQCYRILRRSALTTLFILMAVLEAMVMALWRIEIQEDGHRQNVIGNGLKRILIKAPRITRRCACGELERRRPRERSTSGKGQTLI